MWEGYLRPPLVPVLRRVDIAIQQVNGYPAFEFSKIYCAIHRSQIFLVESIIHSLNNQTSMTTLGSA